VLEVVPHRDQIESRVAEVLVAEEAAAKVDAIERWIRAEVGEVDAGRANAVS
jgi:hypothetical protein